MRAGGGALPGGLRVTALHVYPVKGAAGFPVPRADVDDFGLALDRRWMLVTPDGGFMSQREHPRLALVRTAPVTETEAAIVVDAPGSEPLSLTSSPDGESAGVVQIWNDAVEARRVGAEADAWFSDFLRTECRLVFMPEGAGRVVPPGFGSPRTGGGRAPVSFADGFPLLLISEESLEELNRRLGSTGPLPMNRFRPNIVVRGGRPHVEDGWQCIRIGEMQMEVVKPCARCVVTTVDQETGVAGREPLRTLATYRRGGDGDGKVYFGQNVVHSGPGTLSVGDPVHVLRQGAPNPESHLPETNPASRR